MSAPPQRSWHVPRRQRWRDPHTGLRPVERYVRHIIAQQHMPPRTFDTWYVLRAQIHRRTILALLFTGTLLALGIYLAVTRPPGSALRVRDWLGPLLLFVGLLLVIMKQLVEPLFRWWRAVRAGRYTIATVTQVRRRTVQYGDVVEGFWQYTIDSVSRRAGFRLDPDESGLWIWQIAVECQIYIVVHPTKPNVLIALGFVDHDAPDLSVGVPVVLGA